MSIVAINARNQIKGKIKEIVPGPVVSEVDVETPVGIITSVITTRSIRDLELQVGSEVLRCSSPRKFCWRSCSVSYSPPMPPTPAEDRDVSAAFFRTAFHHCGYNQL